MEDKKYYAIEINGCDDSTDFDMELTDAEYELLEKVSKKSKEVSYYRCMPTLEINLKD